MKTQSMALSQQAAGPITVGVILGTAGAIALGTSC